MVNSRPLRDIRYRGFLTFRGLRLVALIFMSLSQLSMLLVPAARICVVYDIPFLFGNGIVRFLEIAGCCHGVAEQSAS